MSPTTIKASILLNGLRLIGVFDLLLELKKFIIDKLPEEYEEETGTNTNNIIIIVIVIVVIVIVIVVVIVIVIVG